MRVEDIRNMQEGNSFSVWHRGKRTIHTPLNLPLTMRYIEAHTLTVKFGLPNGKGWANETPVTLKVLSHFSTLNNIIENWQIRRESKSG